MNTEFAVGVALFVLGVAGYAAGVLRMYPGRAFSIVAVMLGLLLVSTGRAAGAEAE